MPLNSSKLQGRLGTQEVPSKDCHQMLWLHGSQQATRHGLSGVSNSPAQHLSQLKRWSLLPATPPLCSPQLDYVCKAP